MSRKPKLHSNIKNLSDIDFKEFKIRIGIMGDEAGNTHSDDSGKTNVEIGVIHEFGDTKANIPARSFLRFPLTLKRKELINFCRKNKAKIIEHAANGELDKFFEVLAVYAENIIQRAFETAGFGQWPALAEFTKQRRAQKSRKKTGEGSNRVSTTPLIDTGQLRRSITSKVVKNRKSG